ncbi:hypothetical protein SLA2020_471220 [Shorea laevis]
MNSIDFNIGLEDVGIAVLQELWNGVAVQAVELVSETRDLVLEKDSFQEFSRSISELNGLLQALDVRKIATANGSESTKAALETLNGQLRKARKIIRDYKAGSCIWLLLHSHSVLSQMRELAKEIAVTISSFQLINLDVASNIKSMTNQVINDLRSMEFRAAVATETIASEIENSISQNSRNKEHAMKLLEKIAEAVGANANASMVQNELALLKQEKEEMEAQKKQAEALQLSQLIQLLYSTEIVTRPQNNDTVAYHQLYPIDSFTCPLCRKMMTDPVAVFCGHSFERKAIEEYFGRGEKQCPICREELPLLDLTPNINLRNSIEEWKQRDMDLKFQAAVSGLNSDDNFSKNKALNDMQVLVEMPHYALKASDEGLISKFVESLKDNSLSTVAALKCLYWLAKSGDNQKQAIVEVGAVRCIVKQIYKGEREADATAVLLELSKIETLGEKIGNTKDCIPLLVSLINNDNPDVSQKAKHVLQNLSSNTHFVVKMAEAGYFRPFVARFNQGPQETRALMAAAMIKMQLKENNVKDLKDMQFVKNLIQMLSSNSPAYKSACLKCVKKLIGYRKMVKRFLSDPGAVPALLGLISFVTSDPHLKQEAAEILALVVGACQHSQFQMCQGLQELRSEHNINIFLHLVASSDPQTKIQFLHLLVELCYKSETARDLIRGNTDAINQLFLSLDHGDQPEVRRWAMKLINCISEGHSAGVPLPPSPRKETAIQTLTTILIRSPNVQERSLAAGIISHLPKDDTTIDEILRKTETLKAIHEVISCTDGELGIRSTINHDKSLLENALAALLRFTEPTKPDLQRQVGKLELYPSLVRVLSTGSSLAKQRTAIALAQLSKSTNWAISDATVVSKQAKDSMPLIALAKLFPNMSWCCSASSDNEMSCCVHGAACSQRHTFCLVKADALKPLVRTLSERDSGVAEAALMALETLLADDNTSSHATAAIVNSDGLVAILEVMEKGPLSAKAKALDLFHKIVNYTEIDDQLFQRCERILIQLLHEDELKKRAALVLRQMNVIPEQSSYF